MSFPESQQYGVGVFRLAGKVSQQLGWVTLQNYRLHLTTDSGFFKASSGFGMQKNTFPRYQRLKSGIAHFPGPTVAFSPARCADFGS